LFKNLLRNCQLFSWSEKAHEEAFSWIYDYVSCRNFI
jgi:hypothetical protein